MGTMGNDYQALSRYQLNQSIRLPVRRELAGKFVLTYGFARSKDYVEASTNSGVQYPGDDYIEFWYHNERIVFSVCDGVSGGFRGALAASFLGHKLVDWVKNQTITDIQGLRFELEQMLANWVDDATQLVLSQEPREPGTDIERFEESQKKGSQTMFVVGTIDYETNAFFLAWSGDVQFQIQFLDRTDPYLPQLNPNQRWSTLKGLIESTPKTVVKGKLQIYSGQAKSIKRLTVFTDGLLEFIGRQSAQENIIDLDDALSSWPRENDPRDDVSLLDIQPNPKDWRDQYTANQPPDMTKLPRLLTRNDQWLRVFLNEDLGDVAEITDSASSFFEQTIDTEFGVQLVSAHHLPSHLPFVQQMTPITASIPEPVDISSKHDLLREPRPDSELQPETPQTATNQTSFQPIPLARQGIPRSSRRVSKKRIIAAAITISILGFFLLALRTIFHSDNTPTFTEIGQVKTPTEEIAPAGISPLTTPENVVSPPPGDTSVPPTETPTSTNTATPSPKATVSVPTTVPPSDTPANPTDTPTPEAVSSPTDPWTNTPQSSPTPAGPTPIGEATSTIEPTDTVFPTVTPFLTSAATVIPQATLPPASPFMAASVRECMSFTVISNDLNFYLTDEISEIVHVAHEGQEVSWGIVNNKRIGNEAWVLLEDDEASTRGWVRVSDLERYAQCNKIASQ